MDQGCPNEGPDSRLFGRWGCKIQSWLSFHSTTPPKERVLTIATTYVLRFPPYLAIIIPLPGGKRWLSLRIGWRWDPNWAWTDATGTHSGGYIFPEAILKVMDHVVY